MGIQHIQSTQSQSSLVYGIYVCTTSALLSALTLTKNVYVFFLLMWTTQIVTSPRNEHNRQSTFIIVAYQRRWPNTWYHQIGKAKNIFHDGISILISIYYHFAPLYTSQRGPLTATCLSLSLSLSHTLMLYMVLVPTALKPNSPSDMDTESLYLFHIYGHVRFDVRS